MGRLRLPQRQPAVRTLTVPFADVSSVAGDRGLERLAPVHAQQTGSIAGKVTAEKSGLVVVTWNHDGRALDTGFRPRRKADTAPLTESIATLIGAEQT